MKRNPEIPHALLSCQKDKVALLWGGGLGDLLTIYPLMKAFLFKPDLQLYYMTTANHLPLLHQEICQDITLIRLKKSFHGLFSLFKTWHGKFDLVYLGPSPTWQTRILGFILGGQKVWAKRHNDVSPYVLEQILADIKKLGLESSLGDFPRDLLPWKIKQAATEAKAKPFVVLHPSAKGQWETKCWPRENWQELIERILTNTAWDIRIVGVTAEEHMFKSYLENLSSDQQKRIELCLSWPMQELATLICQSIGVICHNSGILHLATLLKKRIVCLTGASALYWRPPYPWVKNITSGRCDLACNRYRCPIPLFRAKCIRMLSVEKVWGSVMLHLQEADMVDQIAGK